MIERCKPDRAYGRLGITVCDRWRKFDNFLSDMGERPAGHEIDRENSLGHYAPHNCSWAQMRDNRQRRRSTKMTPAIRDAVAALRERGASYGAIARTFGLSKSAVGDFIRGGTWRPHITPIPLPPSIMVA